MFFIRYIAALCYDAIILVVLFFMVTALILALNQGQAIAPSTHWYQLVLIATAFFYYQSSLRFGGQTLGMRAWRFKLSSLNQNNPSSQQILLRILYFIPAFCIAPFYLKSSYTLLNQWTKTQFNII